MKITAGAWDKYIKTLHSLNEAAAQDIDAYMKVLRNRTIAGEITSDEAADALVDYAYAVATKYGEGGAAASCEMYDAIAKLSGQTVPPAVPADTASYNEVSKAVYGTQNMDPSVTSGAVSRLVKMASVDTMMQNALRDGAEWAWIPRGDTCAFCLTLASRGWQEASKEAIKNGHAEHVHAHCDCTYAVRFDSKTNVAGYDPDALLDEYYSADGKTPQEKINAMRRAAYSKNANRINAQKREAYAKRVEREAEEETVK